MLNPSLIIARWKPLLLGRKYFQVCVTNIIELNNFVNTRLQINNFNICFCLLNDNISMCYRFYTMQRRLERQVDYRRTHSDLSDEKQIERSETRCNVFFNYSEWYIKHFYLFQKNEGSILYRQIRRKRQRTTTRQD